MKKLLALFLFVLPVMAYTQDSTKLSAEVEESIQQRIEYGHTPSIAIGIIDKDGPRYYMYGNKAGDDNPVDRHSIYEIGSISKVFTGILLAHLDAKGLVNIDDPVQKYLPDGVTMPKKGDMEITLGHLSDHTSALTRMPENFNPADPSNPFADYTVEQLYEFLNSHELRREIGSEYEYSNLAQGLLGHVLALVGGKSYEEMVIEIITDPLGMDDTRITLSDRMQDNLAVGHSNGLEVSNWDIPTLAGAGAIRSSVRDMLVFLSANLDLEKTPIYDDMVTSHTRRHDKGGMGVGLGWHIADGDDGDVIWHNGGTGGYRTFAGFVKETGKGVVVLTNSSSGSDDIGFHLLNPGAELREFKPQAATMLRQWIDENGIDAAIGEYKRLEKEGSEEIEFREMGINSLGYAYLQKGDLEKALAVFKLNMESYPESSNVYDSYGEALRENGQTDLAIENYKKSVELNPGNSHGIEMLKEMGVEVESGDVTLSEDQLERLIGTYRLAPTFDIVITRDDNQLFLQATGQPRFEVYPISPIRFYLEVVEAQIEFELGDEGPATMLTLFQNGQVIPGKRVVKE